MAAPARMPVPTDPKAPKFDGDDRNLLSFLEDYEVAADAATLTDAQKIRRIVRYVTSDVRDDIEQYEEYQIDFANPPQNAWTTFKARLEKEYPVSKKTRIYTLSEYEAYIVVNRDRDIASEVDLGKFTREIKRYSQGLVKRGILSNAKVAKDYAEILEKSLGQNLALGLSVARRTTPAGPNVPSPDDAYSLDEVFAEAQRIVRSGTLGVGVVFRSAPIAAPTQPSQLAQPVQIKTEEPIYQQLLTKIADLERQQKQFLQKYQTQSHGASSSNDNTMQQPRQSRMSSGCFYCGGGHGIGDCELAKSDVSKGRCRQDGRRIVYPDGSEIRMDGKRLVERVAEFNKAHPEYEKMHQKQSGSSVAAMLVEVGQPLLANALLQAPAAVHEPENTESAEQRWWAFMMDTMHAMVAKQAEKSAGTRTGLRSQAAAAPDKAHETTGPQTANKSTKDAPPHLDKEPSKVPERNEARFTPFSDRVRTEQAAKIVEGTPRVPTPFATAQSARPQFRVQAPVEDEKLAQIVADRVMKAVVPMTMTELAALCPTVRRYLRDQVTPKRVVFAEEATGASLDAPSAGDEATVDVWRYRVIDEEEKASRDLITAPPALPLRFLDCRIRHVEAEGVLDGGAQVVIISKRLWQELGLGLDGMRAVTLEAANSTMNRTEGVLANLPVVIAGLTFYVQAHVIEDAPFDLLLGQPFYAITSAEESHELDGSSIVVLKDPNTGLATRLPTRARSPVRGTAVSSADSSF